MPPTPSPRKLLPLLFKKQAALDSDVVTFAAAVAATGTTLNATQTNALSTFVKKGKADGWWSKAFVVYPMVGGTAAAHALNLKNPASNAISWGGTVTHNALGIKGDGSSGYGDTGLNIASAYAATDNAHLAFYGQSDTNINGNFVDMGCSDGTNRFDFYYICANQFITSYPLQGSSINAPQYVMKTVSGSFITNRYGGTVKLLRNAHAYMSATAGSVGKPTRTFAILATNWGSYSYFSTRQYSFVSLGDGLTDSQATSLDSAICLLQSDLGRTCTQKHIGFIGDSITARNQYGQEHTDYDGGPISPGKVACDLLGTLRGTRIINGNEAHSGYATANWLPTSSDYLDAVEHFYAQGAQVVSIMLGTNDALQNVDADTFATRLGAITNDLVAKGFKVVLHNSPYLMTNAEGGTIGANTATQALLVAYQAKISALINGTTILRGDTASYAYFQTHQSELSDGAHPTAAGITTLGTLWYNAFNALGI